MAKIVFITTALLFIGVIGVVLYEYVQTQIDPEDWGGFAPLVQLAPVVFIVGAGVGGILTFLFVRRR